MNQKKMLYLPLSSVCAAATAGLADRAATERDDARATRSCRKPAQRSLESSEQRGREESKQGSSSKGGSAEYRVARRRGEAVAATERRRAQACGELGGGGRGREQVERHGCAVCWAWRGGGARRGTGGMAGAGYRKERLPSKAFEQIGRLRFGMRELFIFLMFFSY